MLYGKCPDMRNSKGTPIDRVQNNVVFFGWLYDFLTIFGNFSLLPKTGRRWSPRPTFDLFGQKERSVASKERRGNEKS